MEKHFVININKKKIIILIFILTNFSKLSISQINSFNELSHLYTKIYSHIDLLFEIPFNDQVMFYPYPAYMNLTFNTDSIRIHKIKQKSCNWLYKKGFDLSFDDAFEAKQDENINSRRIYHYDKNGKVLQIEDFDLKYNSLKYTGGIQYLYVNDRIIINSIGLDSTIKYSCKYFINNQGFPSECYTDEEHIEYFYNQNNYLTEISVKQNDSICTIFNLRQRW